MCSPTASARRHYWRVARGVPFREKNDKAPRHALGLGWVALPPELEMNRKDKQTTRRKADERQCGKATAQKSRLSTGVGPAQTMPRPPYFTPMVLQSARPPMVLPCLFRALTVLHMGGLLSWKFVILANKCDTC
jgi:hypothetical protein